MGDSVDTMAMKVVLRRVVADGIVEFTLAGMGEDILPAWEAGAHITVHTPGGPSRRYSLVGKPHDAPLTYVIAVKRDPNSRGGSASMHDDVGIDDILEIESPKNDFPLKPASGYLLIAGGIGITPIYAMARQLAAEGKEFNIVYCTRSAGDAAYLNEMKEAFGGRLLVHHDGGDPDRAYDFWDHFETVRPVHVYCCGPKPLMEEIEAVSGHWPEGRVNFEDFKPVDVVRPEDVTFEIELARSSRVLNVPADRTILEAIRDSGIAVASSCESGTCGTCKCRLISGEADHRDMVLMDDERDTFIMPCVSRSVTGRLVLDL